MRKLVDDQKNDEVSWSLCIRLTHGFEAIVAAYCSPKDWPSTIEQGSQCGKVVVRGAVRPKTVHIPPPQASVIASLAKGKTS